MDVEPRREDEAVGEDEDGPETTFLSNGVQLLCRSSVDGVDSPPVETNLERTEKLNLDHRSREKSRFCCCFVIETTQEVL